MNEPLQSRAIQAMPELVLFEHTYSEFTYPKHFHETYLIELVSEGSESFYCNGKTYEKVPHDSLILINPGEVHTGGGGSIASRSQLVCRVIYPELSAWDTIIGESFDRKQSLNPLRFRETVVQDEAIVRYIKKIYSLSNQADSEILLKELYHEVMMELLSRHMTTSISFDENYHRYASAIERGKQFINDNLSEKISVEAIARAAFMSPFHFLRVFKKFTGITLHQYVVNLRIERAKALLSRKGSISDTFTRVGFLNQVHFTKVFRKMTGLTPGQFKGVVKGYL